MAEGVLYLTPGARFDYLLQRPEGSNVGKAVNEAMADIEKHNPQLGGVLPRNYQIFNGTLLKELLKKVSEIPVSLDYDAFGRIYEYFLGQFARTEGQKGGEFYTPAPIVRLMVEILEPFHGRILDPACGSGGMFVQSARFVEKRHENPSQKLTFRGLEKNKTTINLAKMNLAVHGLEGDIQQALTYYDDPLNLFKKCDYVMANPPFNVDEVDADKIKNDPRLPFGLPGVTTAKGKKNGDAKAKGAYRTRTTSGYSTSIATSMTKDARDSSCPAKHLAQAATRQRCAKSSSRPDMSISWSPSDRTFSIRAAFHVSCGSSTKQNPNSTKTKSCC